MLPLCICIASYASLAIASRSQSKRCILQSGGASIAALEAGAAAKHVNAPSQCSLMHGFALALLLLAQLVVWRLESAEFEAYLAAALNGLRSCLEVDNDIARIS